MNAPDGLTDIQARMEKDALAKHLGIQLVEMRPGYARAVMEVKPEHLNGVGITHGGTIFSLADFAFAAASNSHGPTAVALNVSINFLKATTVGDVLTATVAEENLTRKTGLYRMEVLNGQKEIIALAQGTVYRKSQ